MTRLNKIYFSLFFIAVSFSAKAQLIVGEADPYILVTNVLVGKGISTNNISYTGHKRSCGFFENGLASKLKMDAGIILSTGIAVGAKGPNNVGDKSTSEEKTSGSSLLDLYTSKPTYDAATLQFDFTPQTEDIIFNYIFASEEYIEYVDKNVSDIFGFFISGPGIIGEQNVALVPGKSLPVSIDNINHLRNSQYFNLNTIGEKTLQADGYTTILTAN
ncbi:MAG: choice-of-anchor L domain-containing protein, partial [Bacteroidia bacterium]